MKQGWRILKNAEEKSNKTIRKNEKEIDYVFDEDVYLKEIWDAIDSTYTSHYAQNKIQSTEFIADAGHGEGFCMGNIIKYAQRYGKKGGFNRNDLTKVVHYVIIMLYLHDNFYNRESQGEHNEVKW